ncbi:hypothetical protein BDY19DRAFT_919312 [Irpex rosettiformis]|uniref:Uncharacterized protein n=1 Tax=Irpex rosettiformis TaxID=378272 RepID=A0ACB8UHE4_9APHY|nr:hypothetical protein BDY19DRAFT_919312 [Irpex rosettiformis]
MTFVTIAATTAFPTGSGNHDVERRDLETKIGLGLGLPTEVLVTSFASKKSEGLGIYFDFETWDGQQPELEGSQICSGIVPASSPKVSFSPLRMMTLDVVSSPKMMDECPGAPMLSQHSVFSTLPVESIASRLDLLCLVHEDGCDSCASPTINTASEKLPTIIESSFEYEHTSSRCTHGAGLGFNLEDWAGFTDVESVFGTNNGAKED